MEPYSNYDLEKELAKEHIEIKRFTNLSYLLWQKPLLRRRLKKKAKKYCKYKLGADGLDNVYRSIYLGKKKYEEYMELIEKSRERALELYEELAVAADEDREVFLKLSEAYALPKETEEEKKIKQQVLGERSLAATEAPFKVMELSLEGLEITEKLVGKSNKMAVSDLGVAAACFLAACKSAWLNVKINLPYLTDKDRAQAFEKGGRNILEKVTELSEKIYDAVEKEI